MTEEQMQIVAAARTTVVRKFRNKEGGYDRPDTAADPWYKADEWDDDGNYYGPPKAMLPVPVSVALEEEAESDTPPDPDTPLLAQVEAHLLAGTSVRETAKLLGISAPMVQRLKAKLKASD